VTISWVTEGLSAYQQGLCSMELSRYLTMTISLHIVIG